MYCENCGVQTPEDARFCANCGSALRRGAGQAYEDGYAQDTQVDQLAILCYFGLFMLIPLLTKPHSTYIKFHANQGLILFLCSLALGVVAIVPILGWIACIIGEIFCFVCWIIGIVNAIGGRMKPLPLMGGFSLIK